LRIANINHLAAHLALISLVWSIAGIFFMVFLLRAGLPPPQIFPPKIIQGVKIRVLS
jgi:hypothetical protein